MNHVHRLGFVMLSFAQIVCAQGAAIDWHEDLFSEKAKEHSCWFLTLPVSAGTMGTGSIASQGSMDATDLPFFPANTGLAERNSFSVTHYNWLRGMNKEYVGAVYPTVRFGTVGLFSELFTTGSGLQSYTADGSLSRLSLMEYAIGGTFGRSLLNEKLNIGVTAAYLGSVLDDAKSTTESFSVDLLYAPGERTTMRAYLRNIGLEKTDAPLQPSLPLQSGGCLSVVVLQAPDLVNGPLNIVTLGTGVQQTAANPLMAGVSAQLNPFQGLSLRSGYNASGWAFNATGLYAGIGFRFRDLSLDAGWNNQPEKSGPVWAASAAMNLNDFITRSPNDYVLLGNSNYVHQRYGNSLEYAKKALQQDPGSWMAHNLFRKATSALERDKTSELWILYYGNFKGKFLSSNDDGSLGGLARAAAVLKGVRRAIPFSISIATGNMMTLESPPALEKVTHDYYAFIVEDDARCIGQGELDYGTDRILADPTSKPMLCLTPPDSGNNKIVSRTIITRQGCRFAVISAVRNPVIDTLLKRRNSSFAGELQHALKDSAVQGCNPRIVVLHDSWDNIARYGETLKGADIIVCASLDDCFIPSRQLGSCIVVSVPPDGSNIGSLMVRLDNQKRITSYENLWIPLSEDIAPDRQAADWIRALMPRTPAVRTAATKKWYPGDFFAFQHEKLGINRIYIKNPGSLSEVPLANNDTAAGPPSICFSSGKVAYLHTDKKNGCGALAVFSVADCVSTTIVNRKKVGEALFSPNGKWIYCTAADCDDTLTDIYRIRSDGGVLYPLVTWKNSIEKGLAFSLKSPEMVFYSNRDGSWQVYLTDLDGSHPLRLTDDDDNHLKPLFSPNGKYISYLSNHSNADGSIDLWIYNRSRANHVRITNRMNIIDYCWFDNSRKILISAGLDFPELKVVDIMTGTVSKFLPAPRQPVETPWGEKNPRLIYFNGKRMVLYDRDFGDGERVLYWSAVDGSEDRALVDKE